MNKLEKLPNIGIFLASQLNKAGIHSLEELQMLGSKKAFIRIKTIYDDACLNQLYALEGCIRNVRWHQLPYDKKHDLKSFFYSIEKYMD